MVREQDLLDNSIRVDLTKTNLFFTADLHLGHENIIYSCNRPFQDVHDMDEYQIKGFNKVVGHDDTVCIVGDLMFRNQDDPKKYLERLNGRKHLILGNHDYDWIEEKYLSYFQSVRENALVKIFPDGGSVCKLVFLHHYSCRTWPSKHYGAYHLYGHSHGGLENRILPGSFDVGVDNFDYIPLSYEQIIENMNRIKKLYDSIQTRLHKM